MRRTERHSVELSVTWTRSGREIACAALDVGAHGLFLRTDELVEPESLMHLKVRLPDRVLEMFVTACFVGNTVGGHGIGCEIFLIDEISQIHWVQYYDWLCAVEERSRRSVAMGA